MTKPQDDDALGDIRKELGPPESLTLERLIRVARFPIYGLIAYPDGLTLQGFGHTTAELNVGRPDLPWQPDQPQYLWQVSLHYDYLPAHSRAGQRIELHTTDANRPPIPVSTVDEPRYSSPKDVPPVAAQAASFVVEHLPFNGGEAVATVEYTPHERPKGRLLGIQVHHVPNSPSDGSPSPRPVRVAVSSPASPVWSFTLSGPQMWVEGSAYGWTQDDLFAALEQVAIISKRPDTLAQYQRELTAWHRHFYPDMPSV